jgi:electron transport complex protein RnfC
MKNKGFFCFADKMRAKSGSTFPYGGVHPESMKLSQGVAIEVLPLPDVVKIPLAQHIGAPAVAKVAKGDHVLTGQLIAEAASFMSANIHAPISGTVTAVDLQPNGQGLRQMMITIKREGDDWVEDIDRSETLLRECALSKEEILARIKAAGIVGMGGATFPTHVKLSIPAGKKAEYLIINGVECEPYLTSDHRTMLERAEKLLVGVEILQKLLGVSYAQIGVENNKPDAIAHLKELVTTSYPTIGIVPLKVQYPQGGEKQLIAAVTGRQVPPPPGLPIDVGAVVCNASTAVAVYEAVQKRKPLIERVVTVSGKAVKRPANYLVRMGTPIMTLIEASQGLPDGDVKVLNGGPMMGRAMVNLDSPVTKGCSGITLLSGNDAHRSVADTCIKCAKCVQACPMGLEPYLLSKLSHKQLWDRAEQDDITSCIECGSCQYTCPANLPLLDYIRLGKQRVMGIIRARAAANAPKK